MCGAAAGSKRRASVGRRRVDEGRRDVMGGSGDGDIACVVWWW